MAKNTYDSKAIEVLSGLDPVKKRPGMYTDTSCPNHLIQEVLDNSVDEAISGHCTNIKIKIQKDGFINVSDDGRGMPVDIHPEHKLSGVELILCKLHAGAKFSGDEYNFSGGLHGVGVSVVNALSESLQVNIKRDSKEHEMRFSNGDKKNELKVVGDVGLRNTGTSIKFKPNPEYFESDKIKTNELKHLLKAKAFAFSKCFNSFVLILSDSKYSGFGLNFIEVPVFLKPTSPTTFNSFFLSPFENLISCSFESLLMLTCSDSDNALTTETPTP